MFRRRLWRYLFPLPHRPHRKPVRHHPRQLKSRLFSVDRQLCESRSYCFFIVIIGLVLFAILSGLKMTAGRLQQTLEKWRTICSDPKERPDIAETATIMPIKREASSVSSVSQQTEETVSDRERLRQNSKARNVTMPCLCRQRTCSVVAQHVTPSVTSGSDTADTTAVAQAGSSGNVQQNVPARLQETPAVSGVPSSDADNFPPPSDHVIPGNSTRCSDAGLARDRRRSR